jgi:6-phosphogluconolactonase/glucosamine-6-phosphate isomerase/deaminase
MFPYPLVPPVLPITGPKPPFKRLTITPQVIAKAWSFFVLATGSAKAAMLCAVLNNPNDIGPACATSIRWHLDDGSHATS